MKNYLIVLEALEAGFTIDMDGYTWEMMEGVDASNNVGPMLCIKGRNETTKEPHYINPDLGLNKFMRMCESLPENVIAGIKHNVSFNKVLREKYARPRCEGCTGNCACQRTTYLKRMEQAENEGKKNS